MKRTAILGNDPSSKGSSRVELIQALHARGIQPYNGRIWDGKANDFFSKETALLIPIKASRGNTNPFGEIRSLFSVAKQMKKYEIDSVIIYGVKNHSAMAIGARLGGVKRILCIVNGSGNLFRVGGIKGKILRLMAFPALRIAYSFCSSICFQNEDDLNLFLHKRLIKKTYDFFVTGGSGVNLDSFPSTHLPNYNCFLFLSRITATKGLKEYCKAARIVKEQYPDADFDIVGPLDSTIESGEIAEILKNAVDDGIVNYHGFTNQVSKWIQKCRFFIYPSYYPEGVPRCVLQALSTGRPVITCNTPGCRDTVKNGYNGLIVEKKSDIELSDAMRWMLENPNEVENMAKNSRKLAESKFDVRSINELLINKLVDNNV